MLADFIITIHSEPERAVRVIVHSDVRELRLEASAHSRRSGTGDGSYHETLGLCHRFETTESSVCAIVRLAPPNLGVGIISHELAHAAVWIHELDEGKTPLTCVNDEQFCWTLGELVRQTVNQLIEKDIEKYHGSKS